MRKKTLLIVCLLALILNIGLFIKTTSYKELDPALYPKGNSIANICLGINADTPKNIDGYVTMGVVLSVTKKVRLVKHYQGPDCGGYLKLADQNQAEPMLTSWQFYVDWLLLALLLAIIGILIDKRHAHTRH